MPLRKNDAGSRISRKAKKNQSNYLGHHWRSAFQLDFAQIIEFKDAEMLSWEEVRLVLVE
jgi:hypothetical protein